MKNNMVFEIMSLATVYVLGWTNLIGLALVLFSCRCTPAPLPKSITDTDLYRKFYKYHCYYWIFFIASVFLHSVIAILTLGNPF